MLEITQLARGLPVVAQGRSAGGDGLGQDVADMAGQRGKPRGTDPAGLPARIDSGAVQRLGDIDIAQARNGRWSSNAALTGAPAGKGARQLLGAKILGQGSGPRCASSGCAAPSGIRSTMPNRRASLKVIRVPSSFQITTWSWRDRIAGSR